MKPYTPHDAAFLEDLGRWFVLSVAVCLIAAVLRLAVA